jgi:fatty acid desaturase
MKVIADTRTTTDADLAALAEVRRQWASACTPIPWRYWCDLLGSAAIGWGTFAIGATAPFLSFTYLVATAAAVFALLRATIFIHELSHLKRGAVPGIELAWNIVVGVPFLLPSIMYDSHGDHHRQATFATIKDPEYAPIACWSRGRILWFILSTVFVPALLALRWGVIGLLAFFIPPLHRFVIAQASSLVINTRYVRPQPQQSEWLRWYAQEAATAVVFWLAVMTIANGGVPLSWVSHWYVVGVGVAFVNQVRTLAAHRYDNDGRQLTAVEQLLDSINLIGPPWLTGLAAPVGLRYHAVHHFLPNAPYHSLGQLHRQLVAQLSSDSRYRQSEERGILSAVQKLLQHHHRSTPASLTSAAPPAAEASGAPELQR